MPGADFFIEGIIKKHPSNFKDFKSFKEAKETFSKGLIKHKEEMLTKCEEDVMEVNSMMNKKRFREDKTEKIQEYSKIRKVENDNLNKEISLKYDKQENTKLNQSSSSIVNKNKIITKKYTFNEENFLENLQLDNLKSCSDQERKDVC